MNDDKFRYDAATIICDARRDPARRPVVASFVDPATASVSYVLHDPATHAAMIVDPVLDFTPATARISTTSADALSAYVESHRLTVAWIIETHIHADHLSAAALLRDRLGGRIAMGSAVVAVRRHFAALYDTEFDTEAANGGDTPPAADVLFDDGDRFALGEIACLALHVPGHTPADTAIVVGDVVLTGDTLFMPDVGTARADFPGGDAALLFRSIARLLTLPPETQLLHCHDYPPAGRATAWTSTVAQQRAGNIHIGGGRSVADFVALRQARDATLPVPALMLAAVQVNIDGGRLPAPAANGRRYLKLPLDTL